MTWDDIPVANIGGTAVLLFPGGEEITLQGISPDAISGKSVGKAMGMPCFAAGRMIRTPKGEVAVEQLRAGDLVLTEGHGPRPVIWVGGRWTPAAELPAFPERRPIVLRGQTGFSSNRSGRVAKG